MKYLFNIFNKKNIQKKKGFVLPFTLFLCAIMILLTTSVTTVLNKQLYFSRLARQSQDAYYAADNAILCTTIIDSTYTDANGIGIFPYDSTLDNVDLFTKMNETLLHVNTIRTSLSNNTLASSLDEIKCASSNIFNISSLSSSFKIVGTFSRTTSMGIPEEGKISSFNMKMDLGDGNFRCAKVTVKKTLTYRQIIAQGYSLCDRPNGSIERAVISTTILE